MITQQYAMQLLAPAGVRISPISVVDRFSEAVIANTNILGADVSPSLAPSTFTILASFSITGILSVVASRSGEVKVMPLNSGALLQANCLYSFSHDVDEADSINYVYSASCTANLFKVHESVRDGLFSAQMAAARATGILDFAAAVVMIMMASLVMARITKG